MARMDMEMNGNGLWKCKMDPDLIKKVIGTGLWGAYCLFCGAVVGYASMAVLLDADTGIRLGAE